MDKYSEELKSLLKRSEIEAIKAKSIIIETVHFLLAVLSSTSPICKVLNNYNITYKKIRDSLVKTNSNIIILNFDTNFKRIIETTFLNNRDKNIEELNSLQLFLSIMDNKKDKVNILLKKYTPDINLIYKDIQNLVNIDKNLLVYEIGVNLNELASTNEFNKVYNREKEINNIIEILARKNKNNPLLIGEAGVGKTAIVEELARKISKKEVPEFLLDKTIISLNISSVIAGTKYRGEFEDKLNKIIKELTTFKNLILFIDEMHTLIGAGGAEGAIDASNILKPFLARNNIKVIGATTINEYKRFIEKDKAFDRRFQKIIIEEPSSNDLIDILIKIKKDYEKFHNVKISNTIIKDIVFLSNKYILDKKEPDRSIDILDEVCAYSKINNYSGNNLELIKKINKLKKLKTTYIKKSNFNEATKIKKEIIDIEKRLYIKSPINTVTYEDLKYVIENKSNQKILEINDESQKIENLKKHIIGQNENIDKLIEINLIKRKKNNNVPVSILLNGSSGTGKTECVKKYAEVLNLNFIRLDMGEYNNEMTINKIVGSPKGYVGYDDENNTFESLKFYPNSVVLFDEIDKAHPHIINLLYSILDEGKIKSNKNECINFKNSTIFLTTNNLKEKENIGFNKKEVNTNTSIFSNEFINRINYILNFNKLTLSDIKKIINLNLKNINLEYNTCLKLSEDEIKKIINECEYEIYGARKIYNIIKKHLEYKLIKS